MLLGVYRRSVISTQVNISATEENSEDEPIIVVMATAVTSSGEIKLIIVFMLLTERPLKKSLD